MMKITNEKYDLFGFWKWSLGDNEECSICMLSFESPCTNCNKPGDSCPPIEGSCGHIFHMHCISKWIIESEGKCPLCRNEWRQKEE